MGGSKERRSWRWLAIPCVPLAIGAAALRWPEAPDRLFHPARFATSGSRTLPPGAYPDAARRRLGAAFMVADMTLPGGRDPVRVRAIGSAGRTADLYLDPPSARILDIVRKDGSTAPRPLAAPAQPVAAIMARARTVAPGAVRRIVWPTDDIPDWTLTLSGGAIVKVADDTGTASAAVARAAGGREVIRRWGNGPGIGVAWWIAIVTGGVVPAVFAFRRRGKRIRSVASSSRITAANPTPSPRP